MPATIDQIAARAGISAGTVSRILDGKNKENRPTMVERADRVRALAAELGYRPNLAARSVALGRFKTWGFVTCGHAELEWFPRRALQGMTAACEPLGHRVGFFEFSGNTLKNPSIAPCLFREAGVDGFVVHLFPAFQDLAQKHFEAQPLPFVILNQDGPKSCVLPDDEQGARVLTQHLIAKGHRRIGYFCHAHFGSPPHSHYTRLRGFQNAMTSAGLDPSRVYTNAHVDASQVIAIDEGAVFLRRFPDLQAVVCWEQRNMLTLQLAGERTGIRMGRDFAVAMFAGDATSLPCYTEPIVARVPFPECGRIAVEILDDMYRSGKRTFDSVKVPYTEFCV